jgi:hypothetical protein
MIPLQFKSFVRRVKAETDGGSLSWNESDNGAYYCNHKEYALHIWRYYDADRDTATINFRFAAPGGVTPFSVSDFEGDEYHFMLALYDSVIANANNVGDDLNKFFM